MGGLTVSGNGIVPHLVSEYFERKRLSDIGYKFDHGDLTCYEVEVFLIVSSAIDEVREKNEKKAMDKMKRKR